MSISEHGLIRAAASIGISADAYRTHLEAGEKWCSGHQAWHPRSAFNANAAKYDGLQVSCREHHNPIQANYQRGRVRHAHGARP